MAIPAETFTITPNAADGIQRLSDPTGGFTPPTEIDPPTSLTITNNTASSQAIAWTYSGAGHNGFEVERWISGIDSGWVAQETVGAAVRSWSSTGLPSNTIIRHRVRATAADGSKSGWVEVEQTTDRPSGSGGTDWDRIAHYDDWRQVPLGAKVEDYASVEMDAGGFSVASNAVVMPGLDRSCVTRCPVGSDGWGNWGFNLFWPEDRQLKSGSGSEFWYRTQVWYPSGFHFTSSGGKSATKAMRLNRWRSSDNSNRNHIDCYYLPTGSGSTQIQPTLITEEPNGSSWDDVPASFTKGQWATLEMYGHFSNVPVDLGGNSEMRFWINGEPVARFTHLYVHGESAENYIPLNRWHTWWNGGSVDGSDHYIQSVAYAIKGPTKDGGYRDDTPHMARDSSGFPFIGMGNKA